LDRLGQSCPKPHRWQAEKDGIRSVSAAKAAEAMSAAEKTGALQKSPPSAWHTVFADASFLPAEYCIS
jgi:hypothetical protein